MGIALLLLRIGVHESGMFQQVKTLSHARGRFLSCLRAASAPSATSPCILIGVPIWYVVGILVTFSPEFGQGDGHGDRRRMPAAQ